MVSTASGCSAGRVGKSFTRERDSFVCACQGDIRASNVLGARQQGRSVWAFDEIYGFAADDFAKAPS